MLRDFLLQIFSWISFPPAPDYSIKTVSNFFENSWRYSQVKMHHWYQLHRWQICHLYQWHRRQIFLAFLLPLLIPVANFSTIFASVVDTCGKFATGVNDTSGNFATGVIDASGKQWEQLSNCWQLKMNLKKNYLYDNSTTQRCPKEIIQIFWIEDFFHLTKVPKTSVKAAAFFSFERPEIFIIKIHSPHRH